MIPYTGKLKLGSGVRVSIGKAGMTITTACTQQSHNSGYANDSLVQLGPHGDVSLVHICEALPSMHIRPL
jgi:hypothetical protein